MSIPLSAILNGFEVLSPSVIPVAVEPDKIPVEKGFVFANGSDYLMVASLSTELVNLALS